MGTLSDAAIYRSLHNRSRTAEAQFHIVSVLWAAAAATAIACAFNYSIGILQSQSEGAVLCLAAYAFVAGGLLAIVMPATAVVPAVAAAAWAIWFTSNGALTIWSAHDLPRLASLLSLAAIPLWALRKATPTSADVLHPYIPTLDGWRAFAILFVIADHALVPYTWRSPDLNHFRFGQHGVNLFFALSGFLIATRLLQEKAQTGTVALMKFYRRRVFRILPAALMVVAITGTLACLGVLRLRGVDIASAAFYFRNFVLRSPTGGTGHFWSLAIEEQFYLIVPVLILVARRRWMIVGCVAAACASAAWRAFYFAHHSYFVPDFTICLRTDFRLDGLLFGCVLAFALQNAKWERYLRQFLSWPVTAALGLLMIALIWRYPYVTTLRETILWPLLLAGTVLRPDSIFARLLESRPLRTVGVLSYSLYLWQHLFLMSAPVPELAWMTRMPLNFVLIAACATASYYLVERPALRFARKTAKTTREAAVRRRKPELVFG